MTLNLKRPLVFFDLETTGIQIAKDRVVEIAILKVFPNGNKESKTWLVNPEMPIPQEAIEIHGITDEKVANEPTFKELSTEINKMIEGCDLAGFNSNRFDIPLFAEEMLRAGIDFNMKDRVSIDVQVIFHKKEQRTLGAGYQFYCGKELEDAHSAAADAQATYEILLAQIEKYDDLENDIDTLSEFASYKKQLDFSGFIVLNEAEEPLFSFGKYKNQKVLDILKRDPGYYSWILNADFPLYTKKVLKEIKEGVSEITDDKLSELQEKFNEK